MAELRDLKSLDEFRAVERLESEIWGPVDLMPVPILAVTAQRGAVLVGAYDAERLVGFVYSFPVLKPREPKASHWSHMLGVHADHRQSGLGRDLKLAQRDRVLALGLDLIEWTFDPLQAANAHLNFVSLGTVVEEYEQNVYGESPSPLHGGIATDRFICQWWIRKPHVERRIRGGILRAVSHEVVSAPVVNRVRAIGGSLAPDGVELGRREPRVAVDIPLDFTAMLSEDPSRALEWRLQTRELFQHYLSAGYRVVDFTMDRHAQRGRYLLTTIRSEEPGARP
jgi:predicted GNAT superfamily acetyltransferase